MIDQLLKFFVTFLVVVEPIGVIPIFIAMTEGVNEKDRRRMARKGVLIAGGIFLLFAVGGGQFLDLLGISLDAFRIFGGVLLLLIALEMVFARESGSRSTRPEVEEGKAKADISVFPLAFPFIAGPGSLTLILLAFGPATNDPLLFGGLLACVVLALVCTLLTLYLVSPLNRVLGVTGMNVMNRLFGVILGALAAQYVIDGIRGSLVGAAAQTAG
jgi:multiple antibiotic resistance protein